MATTIDRSTKFSLGAILLLVGTVGYGVVHLGNLETAVTSRLGSMEASVLRVEKALDRNTAQIVHDGKALVVLQTMVQALERRVLELERR